MTPKCPDCDMEMVAENGNWYCENCDLEFSNEELGEESGDGATDEA